LDATSALVERMRLGHHSRAASPMTMLDDVLDVETVGNAKPVRDSLSALAVSAGLRKFDR
jgi:hypothetical protein